MNPIRTRRVLALASALLLHAGEARACSKIPLVMERTANGAFVVGAATADTVFAGPGAVRYEVARGHSGPAGERPVYGQVVEARRIGGLAAARLPAGTTRVVLVPWDYGDDCTPTPWTRSARWVRPGTDGLFTASLREPRHWAGGLPTLDVWSPRMEPYPASVSGPNGPHQGNPDSLLTVDQLFAVMQLLPSEGEQRTDATAAAQPLLSWARANPELARRYPTPGMVSHAVYTIERQRLRAIDPPLAGTYRFEVRLNGEAPATFYARTRNHAMSAWNPSRASRDSGDPTKVVTPEGYSILAATAAELDSLPHDVGRPRRIDREGYFSVLMRPEPAPGPDGAQVWRGHVEVSLVSQHFHADSAIQAFARAVGERTHQRFIAGQPWEVGATFLVAPDGSVRVRQTIDLGDAGRMEIRGERISRVVIPDDDPWE